MTEFLEVLLIIGKVIFCLVVTAWGAGLVAGSFIDRRDK